MRPHRLAIRVYYEDTDLAGIVYHANYLRFFERGRTEALRALGVEQSRLKAERGIVFAVRSMTIDYLSPARFDDLIEVETWADSLGAASLGMGQRIRRGETVLSRAAVRVAALGPEGKPARIPSDLRSLLAALPAPPA